MHIVYISADQGIPVFGCKGASIHIQEMVRAFMSQGAKVTLMSPRLEGAAPSDLADLNVVKLPCFSEKDSTRRARLSMDANAVIVDTLSTFEPYDLIYERHSLFTNAPMRVARQADIPGVLEVNAPLIDEQARHRRLPLAPEARAYARSALSSALVVSVVSAQIIPYATSYGARRDSVHVLENAVNPRRFPPVSRPDGPFTVGFLGTLKPWHDVATLVDGFALLRQRGVDARLLIVGDGPERVSLETRVQKLNISSAVEFTGVQQPDEVPTQLARMHVAVAPYQQDQAFYFSPLKIYEYMAAGLPVVASRVGSLDTLIKEGCNGLLCRPDDPHALADVLMRLADDPVEADQLGRSARQEVLANHDWNSVASRVLNLANVRRHLTAAS